MVIPNTCPHCDMDGTLQNDGTDARSGYIKLFCTSCSKCTLPQRAPVVTFPGVHDANGWHPKMDDGPTT